MITRLGTCQYIADGHNIIILGATGNGKTYLSNAFGIAASRNFYTVKYIRMPELLGELTIARGEGQYQKVIDYTYSGGLTTYTVTYKANGSVGDDYNVTGISSGGKDTVLDVGNTSLSYTYDSYNFTSWNKKANGSGTDYTPKSTITITGSTTLYAQWKEIEKPPELITDHITYIYGYPDGSVRANSEITRAEVAAIFYRLLVNPGTASGGRFSDVNNGAWYAQAVDYLAVFANRQTLIGGRDWVLEVAEW